MFYLLSLRTKFGRSGLDNRLHWRTRCGAGKGANKIGLFWPGCYGGLARWRGEVKLKAVERGQSPGQSRNPVEVGGVGEVPAAFFTESRMRLILSTNPNRKSGYILGYFQPPLRGSVVPLNLAPLEDEKSKSHKLS